MKDYTAPAEGPDDLSLSLLESLLNAERSLKIGDMVGALTNTGDLHSAIASTVEAIERRDEVIPVTAELLTAMRIASDLMASEIKALDGEDQTHEHKSRQQVLTAVRGALEHALLAMRGAQRLRLQEVTERSATWNPESDASLN